MKFAVIVQARMNSRRLPNKVLRRVNGKPIIDYVIRRLKKSRNLEKIIVATSTRSTDDAIVDYCKKNKVEFFRGSLHNVAKRFKDAIAVHGLKSFIRVCADSPLIDADIIDRGIKEFKTNNYEIVTNIFERTFPKGQSFEIFDSRVFNRGYRSIKNKLDQEHPTRFFYSNSNRFTIFNLCNHGGNYSKINLCVDTENDLRFFKRILKYLDKSLISSSCEDIVKIYSKIKEKNKRAT